MKPLRPDRFPPAREDVILRFHAQHVIAVTAALWGVDEDAPAAVCQPRRAVGARRNSLAREDDRALACWR